MRRIHLFEIEDQPWCPGVIRDGATDFLQYFAETHNAFATIAPRLKEALVSAGTDRIIDLCSGAGGSWIGLLKALQETGATAEVTLTDLFPNNEAFRSIAHRSSGAINCHSNPVDAQDVPPELRGVRTLFNSFHHFRPHQARAILADAVAKRQAIAVFEGCDNRLVGVFVALLIPLIMLVSMPFVRPFRWSRILFTYCVPVLPLLGLFDGAVSMLRTYNPDELRELVSQVRQHDTFDWRIGVQPAPRSPLGITYLVGVPR
jgi:hypothetical protein